MIPTKLKSSTTDEKNLIDGFDREKAEKEIKRIAESVKSNELFSEIKQDEIPDIYRGLFKNIEEARYSKIRLLNL